MKINLKANMSHIVIFNLNEQLTLTRTTEQQDILENNNLKLNLITIQQTL